MPRPVPEAALKRDGAAADALSVAVTSEPDPSPAAGGAAVAEEASSAVQRAAAAWGVHPTRPGLCQAEWRRPGEVWRCDRSYGHRWRHHYVRD